MKAKKPTRLYKFLKWCLRVCYPKTTVVGAENLPDEAILIVGNHTQMNGPIVCEFYMPFERYTWCAGEMMQLKEVPAYAYRDFWSQKPKYSRPFYKLLSYLIAPLAVCIFNNANTIGVYHDARVASTFKQTVARLQEGASVVVFPEYDAPYNHIINDFHDKFIDVAKLYYKKSGKELLFAPLYVAPCLKTAYLGKPIRFSHDAPLDEERNRICEYLKNEITAIACGLPQHKVVPYRNIPRRQYPSNIPNEVYEHEKASR